MSVAGLTRGRDQPGLVVRPTKLPIWLLVNRYADGAAQLALEAGHFAGVNLGAVFTAMAAHAPLLEILRRNQAKRFFPLVLGHLGIGLTLFPALFQKFAIDHAFFPGIGFVGSVHQVFIARGEFEGYLTSRHLAELGGRSSGQRWQVENVPAGPAPCPCR